ncbi:polysaccharide lyase [Thalassotalea atypica]|uniref:polysaccharide lyase n=1 Tax=Thalassotalea atypica TaxID=2054316 RepID=UPI0025722902|nr:hypothetical protein [Thalassotalea atypica]
MKPNIYLMYFNLLHILSFPLMAIEIDESVTFKQFSSQAKIIWPYSSFDKYIASNKTETLAEFQIRDTDTAREETLALAVFSPAPIINLLITAEKGIFDIYSKESADSRAATLTIKTAQQRLVLSASVDTYLLKGSRKSLGKKKLIKIGSGNKAIITFKLPTNLHTREILSAELTLPLTNRQYGHSTGVVRQFFSPSYTTYKEQGLSRAYFYDEKLEQHPSVFLVDNFEEQSWIQNTLTKLKLAEPKWKTKLVMADQNKAKFIDTQSKYSVEVPFTTTRNLATNLDFYFKKEIGYEPTEAYFRYYLKLAEGANISGGGKMPGFGGTYNKAGWGGRGNSGTNGWSARGSFFNTINNDKSPWDQHMPIGQYIYEVGKNKYGQTISYGHPLSTIKPGKWYSVEQRLKLNTPGKKDGILEAWIDGKKVFSRTNVHLRDVPDLKIEKIWFNFYFGGVDKPKQDFTMFIDNIVIASQYIGPMFTGH